MKGPLIIGHFYPPGPCQVLDSHDLIELSLKPNAHFSDVESKARGSDITNIRARHQQDMEVNVTRPVRHKQQSDLCCYGTYST